MTTNISRMQTFFDSQIPWMDSHIEHWEIPTAVTDVQVAHDEDYRTYNLQGIAVPHDTRGLVIRNGKLIKQ